MEEHATGLVLRTRPLTETSLIVHWLTAEAGRIATVAKGARRPKSPFRGKLDMFYTADFTFARARRSDLHALKEVRVVHSPGAFRRDIDLLQQAAYAVNLVEQTTERDTPLPEVFALVMGYLAELAGQPWRSESVLWFELKLLSLLGLQPDPGTAKVSARTRVLLADVGALDWPAVFALRPDAGQFKELTHFLHGFLIYHFDRLPKGRAAALRPAGARAE